MAKKKEDSDNLSPLDKFLTSIDSFAGKNSGILVKDLNNIKVEKFPTGSLHLDIKLEGGLPKGKMVEIFGINQSGKSSLSFEAAGQFQKKYPDEYILLIDLEDTFTPSYVESLGLDTKSNFIVMKPRTGEEAYEVLIRFSKNFEGGLVILDSFALLLPESEDEGDMGAHQMGKQARLNAQGLRKLFPHASKNKTTILFINQIRDNFDQYKPIATSGGKSLPFYARTRLHLNKVKGEEGLTNGCSIKLIKATYGKEEERFTTNRLIKGKFDLLREIVECGTECGVITRKGAFFSYDGTNIGQGINNVIATLKDNEELKEELEFKIREFHGIESI